jgi:hypothetical protein
MDQIEYQLQRKRIRNLRRDFSTRKLPRAFKDLVLALFDHLGTTTLECWPSQKRLAETVGVNVRSIKRNMKAIERLGLSTITKGSGGTSSHYRLRFDCPAWRKDKTEIVAKVVSLYASKGKGVGTRASLLKEELEGGRVRHYSGDAGVTKGSDAVGTPASPELLQGSVEDAAKRSTSTHEHEINSPSASAAAQQSEDLHARAAAPLGGSLAARPPLRDESLPMSGGDTQNTDDQEWITDKELAEFLATLPD